MRVVLLAIGILLLMLALVMLFAAPVWVAPTVGLAVLLTVLACIRRIREGYCRLVRRWDGSVKLYRGPIALMLPIYATSVKDFWEGIRIARVEAQGLTQNHVPIIVRASVLHTINLNAVDPQFRIIASEWPDAVWRETIESVFDSLVREVIPRRRILPPDYFCDPQQLKAVLMQPLQDRLAGMGITVTDIRLGYVGLPPEWHQPMQERVEKAVSQDVWIELIGRLQRALQGVSPTEAQLITQIMLVLRSMQGQQAIPLTDLLAVSILGKARESVTPDMLQQLAQFLATNGYTGASNGAVNGSAPAASATPPAVQPSAGPGAQPAPAPNQTVISPVSPPARPASPPRSSNGSGPAAPPSTPKPVNNGSAPTVSRPASSTPSTLTPATNGGSASTLRPAASYNGLAVPPNGLGNKR